MTVRVSQAHIGEASPSVLFRGAIRVYKGVAARTADASEKT